MGQPGPTLGTVPAARTPGRGGYPRPAQAPSGFSDGTQASRRSRSAANSETSAVRSALALMLNRAARLRATSAQRGGRRLEGLVDGQDSQRSTS